MDLLIISLLSFPNNWSVSHKIRQMHHPLHVHLLNILANLFMFAQKRQIFILYMYFLYYIQYHIITIFDFMSQIHGIKVNTHMTSCS